MASLVKKFTDVSIVTINSVTNIFTVILFIAYSLLKRFEPNSFVIYLLISLFVINTLLSVYLLIKLGKTENDLYKNLKFWVMARIIANIAFAAFAYQLLH